MRILVTGSSGFVGQYLCPALVAAGMEVRTLVHAPSTQSLQKGVERHVGDVTDWDTVRKATDGIDAIVHLAARVHVSQERAADPVAEFRRVNVGGTRALASAAKNAGVEHFVFASSVKAVGDASSAPWTSATPPRPSDPYGLSKLEAEQLLLSEESKKYPRATVLRFPLMYGPGMKGNMLRLFRFVDRGWPVPVGTRANARSILYVGNAVAAIVHVLKRAQRPPALGSSGHPFFVADGPAISTASLVDEVGFAIGARPRTVRLPSELLLHLGRVSQSVAGDRLAGPLNRLFDSLAVDPREFELAFEFQPTYTMQEGMAITARWFLQS